MLKKAIRSTALLISIYYGFYLLSVTLNNNLWGNILSPIGAFIAFVILTKTYRNAKHNRTVWVLSAIACVSWCIADVCWAVLQTILGIDPETVDFFMYLYLLPNIFLALAIGSLLLMQIRKWNRIQFLLDLIATLVVTISGSWILFFNREFDLLLKLNTVGISTFLYMICDFFILSILFLQFVSSRDFMRNWTVRLLYSGVAIYALTDLVYCWQVFNDAYIPNTLIDGIYMGSLLLIAMSGLKECVSPVSLKKASGISIPLNYGSSSRVLFLLLIPLGIILLRGFDLKECLFLVGVIAIHQALSGIVQNSMWSEYQLSREKEINEELEMRIAVRTKELIKANEELDYLARIDIVTGLNNRWYCMNELNHMMKKVTPDESVALFFMDLDRFKAINDSYGHETGDVVLVDIAKRMKTWKQPDMLLARIGGDEFVIAVICRPDREYLKEIAEQLFACCNEPVSVPPYRFKLAGSIGIALYPQDAKDLQTLITCADIAMYQAKAQNDRRYAFYSSSLNEMVQRRHQIEILLKKADFDEEFSVHYQPQFEIPSGRLIGMESLIRWKSPELGMVSPGEFIPIAEDTGSIVPISEWVIKKAIDQICLWNKRYQLNLKMGINISPKHISSIHFLRILKEQIQIHDMPPEWLDVEITESSAMNSEVIMEEILTELAKMGVSISIDDFGTGYSSISYIKRFDIDRLKIAKPLVDNITSESDAQIVRAIVLMAKSMHIRTIAEGVESIEQCKQLINAGCEEIQGFLAGYPVSFELFEKTWLQSYSEAAMLSFSDLDLPIA